MSCILQVARVASPDGQLGPATYLIVAHLVHDMYVTGGQSGLTRWPAWTCYIPYCSTPASCHVCYRWQEWPHLMASLDLLHTLLQHTWFMSCMLQVVIVASPDGQLEPAAEPYHSTPGSCHAAGLVCWLP